MNATTIDAAQAPDAAHALHCLEVWGGNAAEDNIVSVPGIDAHVVSRPYHGEGSGGDIHYVSTCVCGAASRFLLADVAGHGSAAADLAVKLRKLMRRHINTPDQTRFTRTLSTEFGRLADAGRFATAIVSTYYAPSDHLIVCNAGHPRPLWWRAEERRWGFLDAEAPGVRTMPADEIGIRDLPLGIIEPTSFQQFAAALDRDDVVVYYSDALTETRVAPGRLLGEEGLLDLMAPLDGARPERLATDLLEAIDRASDGPAEDDATVLVLHHNAADPPALSVGERIRVLGRLLGVLD